MLGMVNGKGGQAEPQSQQGMQATPGGAAPGADMSGLATLFANNAPAVSGGMPGSMMPPITQPQRPNIGMPPVLAPQPPTQQPAAAQGAWGDVMDLRQRIMADPQGYRDNVLKKNAERNAQLNPAEHARLRGGGR